MRMRKSYKMTTRQVQTIETSAKLISKSGETFENIFEEPQRGRLERVSRKRESGVRELRRDIAYKRKRNGK